MSRALSSSVCGLDIGMRMNVQSSPHSSRSTRMPALSYVGPAVFAKSDGQGKVLASQAGCGSSTSPGTKPARSTFSPCTQSRSQRTSLSTLSRRYVVPSKSRKLSSAEIAAFEATRDVGAEILQSIHDMKAGKGKAVASSASEAREATGLSQSQFASLLGVSVRTLQGWEQGRKQPSGAARTLLAIARENPKAVLAVSAR